MITHPTSNELVMAVRDWLGCPDDALTGTFTKKVAARALDIVDRELKLGDAAATEARALLTILVPGHGDLLAAEQALCDAIAAGQIDLATPGLLDYLKQSTSDRLAIDQPGYLSQR